MLRRAWRLGPGHFMVDTAIRGLVDGFEALFGSEIAGGMQLGTTAIATRNSPPRPAGFSNHDRSGPVFHLPDDVTYRFDADDQVYRVTVGDYLAGTIWAAAHESSWELSIALPARTAFHLTVLDPISLFAPGRDLMICHGAAVSYNNNAVLIFGRSGSGKSTVSFLLSHDGPSDELLALSDDTFVLDFRSNEIYAWPIHSGFGLSLELVDRLGIRHDSFNLLQTVPGKLYLRTLPRQAGNHAHLVRKIFFLEKNFEVHETPQYVPLNPRQELLKLIESQTSIANSYASKKLHLWRRLADQARSTHVLYKNRCDPYRLRAIIEEG